MDPTVPVVAVAVVAAAVWTVWSVLTPASAKRALAGWVQRLALAPGRSPAGRDRLLRLAERIGPRCCHDKD